MTILAEEVGKKELSLLAKKIKKHLEAPCVVFLTGEMGAGKTTFVQYFVDGSDLPTSPTYSLINVIGNIAHADFYRIKSESELNYLELPLYQECRYIFIEWGFPMNHHIKRELGSRFVYYELKIHEKCHKTDGRKYILSRCC